MLLINTERKHDIVSTAKWLRKYATGLHNTHTVNIVEKTHVALIILIIALQFDVSTSCNEKTKINEMNKNCILFNFCCLFYFRPSKGRCGYIAANCVIMHFRLLWLHSGHVVVYTAILPLP